MGSSARARSRARGKIRSSRLPFLAQGAAQDLPYVRFRQFLPELDVLGALVAGQVGLAVLADVVFGERSVPLHDKELGNFAGVRHPQALRDRKSTRLNSSH